MCREYREMSEMRSDMSVDKNMRNCELAKSKYSIVFSRDGRCTKKWKLSELSSVLYLKTVTYAPTVKSIPDEKRTLYIHMREIISTKEKIYKYIKSYYIYIYIYRVYICTHDRYTRERYTYRVYRIDFV